MNWQPGATLDMLRTRAAWLRIIRQFFQGRGVLEVETPVLSPATVPDPNIDSLITHVNQQQYYLQTSPELYMKRLLAAGSGPVYQVARVFRDGETGRLHNPEFTLVEWYRPGFDQHELMQELGKLASALLGYDIEYQLLTYSDLYQDYTGLDPLHEDWPALSAYCAANQQSCPQDIEWSAAMDWLMVSVIQPAMHGWVFVHDYPASQASLARLHPENPAVARRFELFVDGIELANGFEELTDADEQRQRFEQENQTRQDNGKAAVILDENMLAALQSGLPECSGVALGLDRLLMWASRQTEVAHTMSFTPFSTAR